MLFQGFVLVSKAKFNTKARQTLGTNVIASFIMINLNHSSNFWFYLTFQLWKQIRIRIGKRIRIRIRKLRKRKKSCKRSQVWSKYFVFVLSIWIEFSWVELNLKSILFIDWILALAFPDFHTIRLHCFDIAIAIHSDVNVVIYLRVEYIAL